MKKMISHNKRYSNSDEILLEGLSQLYGSLKETLDLGNSIKNLNVIIVFFHSIHKYSLADIQKLTSAPQFFALFENVTPDKNNSLGIDAGDRFGLVSALAEGNPAGIDIMLSNYVPNSKPKELINNLLNPKEKAKSLFKSLLNKLEKNKKKLEGSLKDSLQDAIEKILNSHKDSHKLN